MIKNTFIVFLLISLLNYIQLKNLDGYKLIILRGEARKTTKKLFGISFDFSLANFDQEIIISYNPTITAKLSTKCSVSFGGSDKGSIQIQNGVVIQEKGTQISLTRPDLNFISQYFNFNFLSMTATFKNKLKTATTDGTVSFSFSPLKVEIAVTINKTQKKFACEGTIIYTINPPHLNPIKVPAFNPQAIRNVNAFVKNKGAIAVGVVVIIAIIGIAALGPAGALVFA